MAFLKEAPYLPLQRLRDAAWTAMWSSVRVLMLESATAAQKLPAEGVGAHLRAPSLGCDGELAQVLHLDAEARRHVLRGELGAVGAVPLSADLGELFAEQRNLCKGGSRDMQESTTLLDWSLMQPLDASQTITQGVHVGSGTS